MPADVPATPALAESAQVRALLQLRELILSGELAGSAVDEIALSTLADRINARLGEGLVGLTLREARHAPDTAERRVPFTGALPPPAGPTLPLKPGSQVQVLFTNPGTAGRTNVSPKAYIAKSWVQP